MLPDHSIVSTEPFAASGSPKKNQTQPVIQQPVGNAAAYDSSVDIPTSASCA
jgi:hypothetical protein